MSQGGRRAGNGSGWRIGPIRLFAGLCSVVGDDSVANVDDFRHGDNLNGPRLLEFRDEVFGEPSQEASDDSLFLLAEEATVLVGDTLKAFADRLDVEKLAVGFGELVEASCDLAASVLAGPALPA